MGVQRSGDPLQGLIGEAPIVDGSSERDRTDQRGKSTHHARIFQNAQIFDFALSADHMAELDALDQTGGTDRALEANWWS